MRSALVPVAACVIAALVVAPNHPAGRAPSEDAGVFFYAAQRLLEGGVPYRDVWDHKPPGVYAVDALGLLLGGAVGVWLLQVVALAFAALASLRAMSAFGTRAAALGTLAWLVAAPRLFLEDGRQSSYVEFYGLPLQLLTLALIARQQSIARDRKGAIAIGALGGAAFLLKPTLGGIWLAIGLAALVSRRGAAIGWLVTLAAAATAVIALGFAPFVLAGAGDDLLDQVFRYNSAYAAFASVADRTLALALGVRLTLPSGLALVAAAAWFVALSRFRTAPPVLRVAVIALPIEMAFATFGRAYNYYFLAWLPAMGVLAAFAANEVEHRLRPRLARAALIGAAVLTCLVPTTLLIRLVLTHDNGVSRAAAAYVDANSAPSDTVLVWGSRTEVLVLADRVAPTRYVYQYAALETIGYASAARINELIADLERRPPLLIIDASLGSFVTPPLDRAGLAAYVSPEPQYAVPREMSRVVELVERSYERVGTLPQTGWPVWRLRSR
jgi:hypothetical protein